MTEERRAELVEICRRHDVLIVEDNPYGLLSFDGVANRAMKADNPDGVLYLGSFSKIFGPGLRVGWMVAPRELQDVLVVGNEITMLNAPTFNQLLIARYLSDFDWQGKLGQMRELYRHKSRCMLESLERHMPPGTTWNEPDGGFYIWVTVPEGVNTDQLAYDCVPRGVTFVPGTAFYRAGGDRQMRLSYCLATPDQIETGIAAIGTVLTEHLAGEGASQTETAAAR